MLFLRRSRVGLLKNRGKQSVKKAKEIKSKNIKSKNVKKDVDKMIELCQKGPKHSVIRKVEVKDEKFQGLKTFKILHI